MLLTRSPLVYPRKGLTVRLACVKHAASVRPEPGSNSPLKTFQHPPTTRPAGKHCQQKEDTDKQKQPKLAESINQSQRKNRDTTTKGHADGVKTRQTTQPPKRPHCSVHQKIGIDLKHAVEFSSFGYTPRQPRQKTCPDQPQGNSTNPTPQISTLSKQHFEPDRIELFGRRSDLTDFTLSYSPRQIHRI